MIKNTLNRDFWPNKDGVDLLLPVLPTKHKYGLCT